MGDTHKTESNIPALDVLASHPTYRNCRKPATLPVEKPKAVLPRIKWGNVVLQENGDGSAMSSDGKWSIVKETTKQWGTRYGALSCTRDFHGVLGWAKTKQEAIALIEKARSR